MDTWELTSLETREGVLLRIIHFIESRKRPNDPLERHGLLEIIAPQVKELITQHISIEIGASRFGRGRQKRLIGGCQERHVV